MKRLIKISLLITILFLMLGCGSKKTSITAVSKITDKSVTTEAIKETTTVETKHFGDTLKGTIPLPKLSKEPVKLMVESGGQKLEFEVTDNSIAYKSIPKHIASTIIKSEKQAASKVATDVNVQQDLKVVKKQKPWRPPWWWYGIAIIVLVGIGHIIKQRLNPLSSINKFFTK